MQTCMPREVITAHDIEIQTWINQHNETGLDTFGMIFSLGSRSGGNFWRLYQVYPRILVPLPPLIRRRKFRSRYPFSPELRTWALTFKLEGNGSTTMKNDMFPISQQANMLKRKQKSTEFETIQMKPRASSVTGRWQSQQGWGSSGWQITWQKDCSG